MFSEMIIRDGEANKLSAINVFDGLATANFPILIPTLCFYALFKKEAEDQRIYELVFHLSASGVEVWRQPYRLDFESELACRAIIRVLGFPIEAPGNIKGEFKIAGKSICSYEFSVVSTQPVLTIAEPAIGKQLEAQKIKS